MKIVIVSFVIVASIPIIWGSPSVNIQMDINEDDLKPEYCNFPRHSPFWRECALFKCSEDRTRIKTITCPYSRCPNKLSYNEERYSKPYPECCAPPEC